MNKVFYASVIENKMSRIHNLRQKLLGTYFRGFFITRMWLNSKSGNSTASYFCITLILVIYFSNRMTNYHFGSKIHNWHVFCSASYLPAMGLNDKWYVHWANAVSLRCDDVDERPACNWTFHLRRHNAFSRENLNRK